MEARHSEMGHRDHLSVAVEIKQTEMEHHHHAIKERQLVQISTENLLDTTNITVTDADDGQYVLMMKNPKTLAITSSSPISPKATATQFSSAVWKYYWWTYWSHINVKLHTYDAAGNITSNATLITKRVYQIEVRRLISSESVSSILVAKTSTKAKIVVLTPGKVQLSSPPLSGKYKFKCTSKTGAISYSDEISFNNDAFTAQQRVFTGCSQVYDKIKF